MEKLYFSAKTRPGDDLSSDHELLIAKFMLKLKKVGKTTRPFGYDINQLPNDYTVEVTNRFKGVLGTEFLNIAHKAVTKTILKKKKCKKAKWVSEEVLQIAEKIKGVKKEKGRDINN